MSDTDDIKILKKNFEKLAEQHDEIKKDFQVSSKELQTARLELSKINRKVEEVDSTKKAALQSKLDLDSEYKRQTEIKKDNELKIRDLMSKILDLQLTLDNINANKNEQEKKKAQDVAEVDNEKESLKNHQKHYDRQLDEERRALQSKFLDDKLELRKQLRQEADDMKLRHEKQIGELEREKRRNISELSENFEKKISNLEHDNYMLKAKLDQLNRSSAEKEVSIANLEKKLRRELLNVEVMGTSKIDWLKEQSTPPDVLRHFKAQEKKIEQLRYKLNQTEAEDAIETRQTMHLENLAKELQREVHEQELLYQRLEATKDDAEKRYIEKVEKLERELNSKNLQLEAEFSNVKVQLESSIVDKEGLIKALKLEISELDGLVRENKQNNTQLSSKLADRLDKDRVTFIELDKARRDAAADVRKAKAELETVKKTVEDFENQSAKYKKQYNALIQDIETIMANNQKLEKAERRLLTRV
eukprot:TRINITY_DN7851_c0_g1_i1.p1 TRINITY_DN7851_c0_g1~~TRINITY_DN7851_c0_g1_i1.p1  ORF type:complete len:475 (+),score=143.20 TRINITY_DN7851_c0_g1_i1:55-1479(+)